MWIKKKIENRTGANDCERSIMNVENMDSLKRVLPFSREKLPLTLVFN